MLFGGVAERWVNIGFKN